VLVFAGYAIILGVALLISFLRSYLPTPEESCKKYCSDRNKVGQLRPQYQHERTRFEQTQGVLGRGPMTCECFP
jgi:hypothetical protein